MIQTWGFRLYEIPVTGNPITREIHGNNRSADSFGG
jgi:hypothetical protein